VLATPASEGASAVETEWQRLGTLERGVAELGDVAGLLFPGNASSEMCPLLNLQNCTIIVRWTGLYYEAQGMV
jgi:hypothetical protein